MLPRSCCQPRRDDDATTRKRRPSQSLQVPGALTVAAALTLSRAPQAPSQSLPCGCPAAQAVAAVPRHSRGSAPALQPLQPKQSLQPPDGFRPHSWRPAASSRCISQVPLTVAAPPQAVTVAAASRARIAVRIEAGRDGDDAATTGR